MSDREYSVMPNLLLLNITFSHSGQQYRGVLARDICALF